MAKKKARFIRVLEWDLDIRQRRSNAVWWVEANLGEAWESVSDDLSAVFDEVWGEKYPFWTNLYVEIVQTKYIGAKDFNEVVKLSGPIPARRHDMLGMLVALNILAERRKALFNVVVDGKHYQLAIETNELDNGPVAKLKLGEGLRAALAKL